MQDPLAHVWAKSPNDGGAAETLTDHTRGVLSRLAGWRRRYPRLPAHTSRPDLWNLAAWACALHDVGKVARGFQTMLRGGPQFADRHEVLSLVAVGWLDVDEEALRLVAAAVATHHRDRQQVFEMYPAGSEAVAILLEQMRGEERAVREWIDRHVIDPTASGFAPLPALLALAAADAFGRAMAAVETLAGELDAEPATTATALAVRAMRGLLLLSDHAASAHETHAEVAALASTTALRAQLGPSWIAHAHQDRASQLQGHGLLVAPTGSGKTEAALLWAAHQRETSPGTPSVFYVLPYRASLNAMYARIRDRYRVPEGAVVLQHATATASLYKYLLEEKAYTPEAAARVARHGANLARLMTAPVRVLTPYQLLRAFFGLRGHDAVLADAAGGLFVLDELHAYDVARLGLVLAAVRHLARDLGARFFAMSATFPAVLREALVELLGDCLTEVHAARQLEDAFRRHTLRLREADLLDDDTLDLVRDRSRSGEAVLVVATTVARAQAAFDALRIRLGDGVWMLHGRFTVGDRASKEADLGGRVGTGRGGRASGTVLVATQVVEVSLDIDFDVLLTDPAPIESLVQRFGRVNRGRRGGLRDVVVCTRMPPETKFVYDAQHVEAALSILRPHHDRPVDEPDIQVWVDTAYAPIAGAWKAALQKRMREVSETVVAVNRPLDSHSELGDLFDDLFDGKEVVPECFAESHAALTRSGSLEAAFLHVPLSARQWRSLRGRGRLGGPHGKVALLPYSFERGLDLGFRDDDA